MSIFNRNPIGYNNDNDPVWIPNNYLRQPKYSIDNYRDSVNKLTTANGLLGEFVSRLNPAFYNNEEELVNQWNKSWVESMIRFSSQYHPRLYCIPINVKDIVFIENIPGNIGFTTTGPAYFYIPDTGPMENNIILETLRVYGGTGNLYDLNSVLSGMGTEFGYTVQKLEALLRRVPRELFTYERQSNRIRIDSGIMNIGGYLSPIGNNGLFYVLLCKIMHEKDLSTVKTIKAKGRFKTLVFGTMAKNLLALYNGRIGAGALNIPNGTLEPSTDYLTQLIEESKELDQIFLENESKFTELYTSEAW